MNWSALESKKCPELPAEMKASLLRHIYNRRSGTGVQNISCVTPRKILDDMKRNWHLDGALLNHELDNIFAAGKRVSNEQRWKLFIEKSPTIV
jgi:hypothetical protein